MSREIKKLTGLNELLTLKAGDMFNILNAHSAHSVTPAKVISPYSPVIKALDVVFHEASGRKVEGRIATNATRFDNGAVEPTFYSRVIHYGTEASA